MKASLLSAQGDRGRLTSATASSTGVPARRAPRPSGLRPGPVTLSPLPLSRQCALKDRELGRRPCRGRCGGGGPGGGWGGGSPSGVGGGDPDRRGFAVRPGAVRGRVPEEAPGGGQLARPNAEGLGDPGAGDGVVRRGEQVTQEADEVGQGARSVPSAKHVPAMPRGCQKRVAASSARGLPVSCSARRVRASWAAGPVEWLSRWCAVVPAGASVPYAVRGCAAAGPLRRRGSRSRAKRRARGSGPRRRGPSRRPAIRHGARPAPDRPRRAGIRGLQYDPNPLGHVGRVDRIRRVGHPAHVGRLAHTGPLTPVGRLDRVGQIDSLGCVGRLGRIGMVALERHASPR